MKSTVLTIALIAAFGATAGDFTADLIIYGSSPAAVTAAVKATDMGLKPIIVSPEKHVGGLSVSGLGFTDSGNTSAIGGLARDFYRRIYTAYRDPAAWKWQKREDFKAGGQETKAINHEEKTMWTFEPHIAERVFADWMAERKIAVRPGEFLDREKGVAKKDGRITAITTFSGNTYTGRYFIDATYEGDLMAAAGVPYRVGRESCAEFGEKWNGNQVGVLHHRHHFRDWKISPYKTPGDPSSGFCQEIDAGAPGVRGTGDKRVQAYCYRLCLTDDPRNRIPFAKPAGYDPARYELLARCYAKGYNETFSKFDRIANHKTDANNHGPMSFDWLGGSYEWPEATYGRREELAQAHRDYQMGLLYFLANDPSIPEKVLAAMSKWGLAKDEFVENGGWPYHLYVREGRRMAGAYTMTEHDCLGEPRHPAQGEACGSIGMGSYSLDSHNVRRHVTSEGFVQNEGDIGVHPKAPYGIDYGAIVPRKADCANLLVPVALSATHTAFGSIRMEPVFMLLGESAATAAAIAAKDGRAVQDVAYAELAARLRADGQILSLPDRRSDLSVLLKRFTDIEARGDAVDAQSAAKHVADAEKTARLLSGQAADGSWPQVDYKGSTRSSWSPGTGHLNERTLFLAREYHRTKNPGTAAAAKKGLDYWVKAGHTCPNWWWNEIGAPQAFALAALMVDGTLTDADRKRYADYLEVSQVGNWTGQNRVWLARIVMMRGILRKDEALVDKAIAEIAGEVRYGEKEGPMDDGSFRQHGAQLQFGNYGASFILNQARLADVFAGTKWAYPAEKLAILKKLLDDGYRWIDWKGRMDVAALGRQLTPDGPVRKAAAARLARKELGEAGVALDDSEPLGFRYFPKGAYAVYRTETWMASVKMHTPSILETETWVNGENTLGGHLADGSLFLYATGREYDNIFPLWKNWNLIPGVTAYRDAPPVVLGYHDDKGSNEEDEIVAAEKEGTATLGFVLQRDGLRVRKHWTFTPTNIVASGAVERGWADGRTVVTTVEHARAADNFAVLEESENLVRFRNGAFVYAVHAPRSLVRVRIEERSGDYVGIYPPEVGPVYRGSVLCAYVEQTPERPEYRYEISRE